MKVLLPRCLHSTQHSGASPLMESVSLKPKQIKTNKPTNKKYAGACCGRGSDNCVMSKGGFQASLDLKCDQLNMKKCLIKLIWKSLKGSQKLKATMPVPHGIWQSSRSPLATNAGLSLQRDVQPFHFSGCHHGSRGTILGAAIPTTTLPL